MSNERKSITKSLSPNQYGMLYAVEEQGVTLAELRGVHQTTLSSLLARGYFLRSGTRSDSRLLLSTEGRTAYTNYRDAVLPQRLRERDLAARVEDLLELARLTRLRAVRASA